MEPEIDDPTTANGWCKTNDELGDPTEPRDFCKWCGPKGVYETMWKRNPMKARRKIYKNISKLICGSRACYRKTDEEMADWTDGQVWAYCNKYMKNCYTNLSNLMLRPRIDERYCFGEPRYSALCREYPEACGHWTMKGKYWDDDADAWVTPY